MATSNSTPNYTSLTDVTQHSRFFPGGRDVSARGRAVAEVRQFTDPQRIQQPGSVHLRTMAPRPSRWPRLDDQHNRGGGGRRGKWWDDEDMYGLRR